VVRYPAGGLQSFIACRPSELVHPDLMKVGDLLSMRTESSKYVLALGGGGARGLAHIGVLKILQAERVRIKAIAGVSMGAIIGAMYCVYGDAVEVEEIVKKFLRSQFHQKFSRTFFLISENPESYQEPRRIIERLGRSYFYLKAASKRGIFSKDILEDTLEFLLPDVSFSDLKIPFISVSSDLITGRQVVFKSGRLRTAVVASSLIPGIVEPAESGRVMLADGSATGVVPVRAAYENFGGKVIAVDVSMTLERDLRLRTAFDVALRANELTSHQLNEINLEAADVVIRPAVGNTNWANFDKLAQMIRAGETSGRRSLAQLKKSR
jgi:NTE family protein